NPGVLAGSPCTVPTIASPTEAEIRAFVLSCATRNIPGGSKNGIPFWEDDLDNFAPVVSLAWDPWGDGKTSIRAGYRLSYFQDPLSIMRGNVDDNEGLRINQDCEWDQDNCLAGAASPQFMRDGFLTNTAPPFVLPTVRTHYDSTTIDFRTYDPKLKTPYYTEWSVGISREFARNWAVEARFVANNGLKLRRIMDFNEPNIFAFDPNTGMTFLESFQIAQANQACNALTESGSRAQSFRDRGNAGDPLCQALPNAALLGPNDLMEVLLQANTSTSTGGGGWRDNSLAERVEYGEAAAFIHRLNHVESSSGEGRGGAFMAAVLRDDLPLNFFQANPFVASARMMVNNSFSRYRALEVEVRRRFANGFTFEANYNFGRALADYDGDANQLLNEDRITIRDLRYEYGDIMPRQQFNANWIYELPFGARKPFALENAVARKLLEGWQFGGIVRWRSGRPLNIRSGRGSFTRRGLNDSNRADLAQPMSSSELHDLTGAQTLSTGPFSSGVFWFDPSLAGSLFVFPPAGRAGNLRSSAIFGPSRLIADINFTKRTFVTETVNVEFRWEIFNVLNHTNFNVPVTNDILHNEFGQIRSTITNPRLMQLALKINFYPPGVGLPPTSGAGCRPPPTLQGQRHETVARCVLHLGGLPPPPRWRPRCTMRTWAPDWTSGSANRVRYHSPSRPPPAQDAGSRCTGSRNLAEPGAHHGYHGRS
ncbi:MAG: hypothetical protein V3U39_03345, partial [Acidimicrobiia bacterium]